jgi:hypothetical protein
MWSIFVAGGLLIMSTVKSVEPQARSFLVLNNETVDVVGGKFGPAKWPLVERWDPKVPVHAIDGLEFPVDRAFWQMVEKNDAKFDARPEVKVGGDGQVTFRGKSVDVGIRIRGVHKALHWNGSVVGIATIIGDARRPDVEETTILGPVWYVVWFSETTLKGSFRRVATGMPTLRIYSR